jgi:hypothetical protein
MQTATALATAYEAFPDPEALKVPAYDDPRALRAIWHHRGVTTYRQPTIHREVAYRDDPIGQMYKRRQLGPNGRILLQAARHYQAVTERLGIGKGRSPSDLREWVDGGRLPASGVTDIQKDAATQRAHWRKLVGMQAYRVLEAVLIDKHRLRKAEVNHDRGMGKRATLAGRMIRTGLAAIAKDIGLTT